MHLSGERQPLSTAGGLGGRADLASSLTRRHLRGSSLLLGGRGLSLLLNFVAQVLIVRFLSKADYGSLAYALSVVTAVASLTSLGLDKAASRFLPIYEEMGDRGRLGGALFVMAVTLTVLGLAVVLAVIGLQDLLLGRLTDNPTTISVLVPLIALAPLEAFDRLFASFFAVFVGPKAIFLRRHVVAPVLKLVMILALGQAGAGAVAFAVGHLLVGLAGIGFSLAILVRFLHESRLLAGLGRRDLGFPVKELFAFGVPLLSSDLAVIIRGTLLIALMEIYFESSVVAEYRAVVPLARLNMMVQLSFSALFVPAAARLYVGGDHRGVDRLYRQTSLWLMLLSSPIFMMTFALSGPVVRVLFGSRYESSASILTILALGHFLRTSLGFNALTLRVYDRVRLIVSVDLLAVILGGAAGVLLIPLLGALGAALANAATTLVHGLLYQAGARSLGIAFPDSDHLRLLSSIVGAGLLLLAVQTLWTPPLLVGIALALSFFFVLIVWHGKRLEIAGTFPELEKISRLVPGLRIR